MPGPHSHPPPAAFAPRFTLSLLYLFAFFLSYCLLFVTPELWLLLRPAGPDEAAAVEAAASEVARRAVAPRLPIALAAALASLFLATRAGWLPGLRNQGN